MIRSEAGRLLLEGPVTLDTVPALASESEPLLAQGASVIDFAGVTDVGSSALALALEWRRQAGSRNVALRLENVPLAMQRLAMLYGVSELLQPAPQ